MKKVRFFIVLSLFLLFSKAYSQQIEDIFTDRPDQTESPDILNKNFFQIETGINYEKNNSDPDIKFTNYSIPEMLIRYGLNKNVELRLALNYVREDMSLLTYSENNIGLKPLGLGIKIKLFEEKKLVPKTSVLLNFDVPGTGSEIYKVKHISPDLKILLSNEITDKIDIGYNIGISWDNEEKANTEYYTISLGAYPFKRFGFFIESYGFFTKSVSPDFRMDYGISYLILKNLNIDVSSGLGLTKISPDYFIDFGFSIRLPK
ncbi:MAG: transporter [Ignavibacteriae bacterium]|nr:transporter [Ignavibacteriota bacterium]